MTKPLAFACIALLLIAAVAVPVTDRVLATLDNGIWGASPPQLVAALSFQAPAVGRGPLLVSRILLRGPPAPQPPVELSGGDSTREEWWRGNESWRSS